MNATFKRMALLASVLILFLFIIFVINQTAQVVQLARSVSLLGCSYVGALPALWR
jgi:hypothetical protein